MTKSTLAIDGGAPAVTQPLPPMYPGGMRIGLEEEQAVLDVLRSKRLFRYYNPDGPDAGASKVEALEQAFAARVGVRHCVAVSSGTASLMGGLAALDVGPGDEVIVPAYTWVATAAAVAALGAVPVLVEVDASLTLDPADVEGKITPRTKAIVAVHMRGGPCRMDEIMALARRHDLSVLEDAAQANGGSYKGRKLGSIGHIGAFSLQFSKVITCGEGGLITADGMRAPKDEVLPGVMLRLSELQGAVALAQLGKLDALIADMRRNRAVLKASIAGLAARHGIAFRDEPDPDGDAGVSLIFFMPEIAQARWVSEALAAEGLSAWVIYDGERDQHVFCDWPPIVNRHRGAAAFPREMCPRTLDLLQRAVHLDVSPDLTGAQLEEMADGLHKVLNTLA
jgi:dTDP-4-amino-4,6-dideoxygalactose transaminase